MRQLVASVLVVGCVTAPVAAFQARTGGAAAGSTIKACSLLPKELVARYWTGDKRVLDALKPNEEPLGVKGSSCGYGDIELQIDPFPAQVIEDTYKKSPKEWTPVSGVADRAFFRNNGDRFAELMVISGAHTVTIQMGIPTGKTAELRKPDTIAVAKDILPKLK